MTKAQLKKLGVTYRDTAPNPGGFLERKVAPFLICDTCAQQWPYPIQKIGARSLPEGFWICPNRCNADAEQVKPQPAAVFTTIAQAESEAPKSWKAKARKRSAKKKGGSAK